MDWINEEFKNVDLGDRRLNDRIKIMAEQRMKNPGGTIPECSCGKKGMKAMYRFFDNPYFEHNDITKSHKESTVERIRKEKVVLAIQDTTSIDYSSLTKTEGLGVLEKTNSRGVILHTTLAVSEDKKALGLIEQKIWSRKTKEERGEKRHDRHIPIEEKESYKWIESLKKTNEIQKQNSHVKIVNVGDREVDIYEYFETAIELNQNVVARVHYNREIEESTSRMIPYVAQQEISGTIILDIPKDSRREARVAQIEVRYAQVTLKPPRKQDGSKLKEIVVNIIIAQEKGNSKVDQINWIILTNMSVNSFLEACEKIKWYSIRWQIEVFHKILKSGCKIEEKRFGKVENIMKYIVLDSIIAWRILNLTISDRGNDAISCSEIFSDEEWQAMYCYENKTREVPDKPPTLNQMRLSVAKLGGFLGRNGDGLPGIIVMWRGFKKLSDIVESWKAFGKA